MACTEAAEQALAEGKWLLLLSIDILVYRETMLALFLSPSEGEGAVSENCLLSASLSSHTAPKAG